MQHRLKNLSGSLRRRTMLGLLLLLIPAGLLARVAYADTTYVVQPGDTLSGIAAQFGVTVEAIMTANNLESRSLVYAGQTLIIPSPGSTPAPPATFEPSATPASTSPPGPSATRQPNPATYVVQPGEHLTGLAAKFGLTREALAAANGISPSSLLYVGQVLNIPPAGSTPVPTATPTRQPTPLATRTVLASATTSGSATASSAGTPGLAEATAQPGKAVKYVVQSGDNLSSIALKFNTTVTELIKLNGFLDGNFLEVGQIIEVVPGDPRTVRTITPTPQPSVPVGKYGPKWVDVNLTTQSMVVYEGQTPVLTSRVSTGLGRTPTVTGTYRVYLKYRSQTMRGTILGERYEVPNVPDVMYFFSGYALHGAYWHNNFGRPMSHGCVNLPLGIAKQLFQWAPEGTIVMVHY